MRARGACALLPVRPAQGCSAGCCAARTARMLRHLGRGVTAATVGPRLLGSRTTCRCFYGPVQAQLEAKLRETLTPVCARRTCALSLTSSYKAEKPSSQTGALGGEERIAWFDRERVALPRADCGRGVRGHEDAGAASAGQCGAHRRRLGVALPLAAHHIEDSNAMGGQHGSATGAIVQGW